MVRYHPNEQAYFNVLAGTKMSDIEKSYTVDPWGLSLKQGLDFIVHTDGSQKIRVSLYAATEYAWDILPKSDSDRLFFTDKSPEYIIWHVHISPFGENPPGKKVFSVKVGDADILAVFKVDSPPNGSLQPGN
jgi:hypothetical protein